VQADASLAEVSLGPEDIPGGRGTGIFLHAILERLAFSTVRSAPAFEDWRLQPAVSDLFDIELETHSVETRFRTAAERLVYHAITTPLHTPFGVVPSMADIKRERREIEFLYSAGQGKDKTLLKGFIDVLFEYDGRLFILDWKSDVLPDYSESTISAHVVQNYLLQAEIYALALARALGGRAPAGTIFFFMRGSVAHFVPTGSDQLALAEVHLREHLEAS